MIDKFRGDYYFLSNFFEAPITWEGITYEVRAEIIEEGLRNA